MSTPIKFFQNDNFIDFEDFWNNEKFKEFRKIVNNEDMHHECKLCYPSSHTNWNKKEFFIQIGQNFARSGILIT